MSYFKNVYARVPARERGGVLVGASPLKDENRGDKNHADGSPAKMNGQQIRKMLLAIDCLRPKNSDFVNWSLVLEVTGLEDQGWSAKQLKEQYGYLKFIGVWTMLKYELYHDSVLRGGCTEPLTNIYDSDKVQFPARRHLNMEIVGLAGPRPLRISNEEETGEDQRRNSIREISDNNWCKVLKCDRDDELLVDMRAHDWKQLFSRLNIETEWSGDEIMKEFYAKVVSQIRHKRFGKYGKHARIMLRQANQMTMIAIYHALEPHQGDISRCFEKLLSSRVLTWQKGNDGDWPKPLKFWSEAFFDALKENDHRWFAAEKEKFRMFKSYFLYCQCCV